MVQNSSTGGGPRGLSPLLEGSLPRLFAPPTPSSRDDVWTAFVHESLKSDLGPRNHRFTVAHWKNGEIIEENLFYDLLGLLKLAANIRVAVESRLPV